MMSASKRFIACLTILLFAFGLMQQNALSLFAVKPTASRVLVDGKAVAFQAYTIGESNYFKLRDIAMTLNGTAKQFEVLYDGTSHSVTLYKNTAYTAVGGEMAAPGGTAAVNAARSSSNVYLGGAALALSAFTIGGNNYFKLRDIAGAIDFGVIWDGDANTIRIDTTKSYDKVPSDTVRNLIIDHACVTLDLIPTQWVDKARADLHIAYGHTSHGSQITTGMLGLTQFRGSPFLYRSDRASGSLDLRDTPFGESYMDLGQPDNKTWAAETRTYLKNNTDINVVMWSWCGQMSSADEAYVNSYLSLMQALEADFPAVTFVYMTGHLDGSGENGQLARNNSIIREFCRTNNKVLFDFADIESYNPDGVYFGNKYANDACDYDSNGDKSPDKNWAKEWQNTHTKGVDWYDCEAAHSQPVNANMKAYAAWWLMARLAGWNGVA